MDLGELTPLARRILALGELQRKIILNLMQKIRDCEGDIPETHWCSHCIIRAYRCEELLKRFERLNKDKAYVRATRHTNNNLYDKEV